MEKYYTYPLATEVFTCTSLNSNKVSEDMIHTADTLKRIFLNQGINCTNTDITNGFTNTIYRFELRSFSVTQAKIKRLEPSLDMYIRSSGAFISFPKGESGFAVNVPNSNRPDLHLGTLLNTDQFFDSHNGKTGRFSLPLGVDENNNIVLVDFNSLPHLIIAGSTGSGKSVCLNSIINSLLYQAIPNTLQFLMIDPKKVELSHYEKAKYSLYSPVVTEEYNSYTALSNIIRELDLRYKIMQSEACTNLDEYNSTHDTIFPRIVVVIDELADLFMTSKNEIQPLLIRIAQLGRAAGIHLILATQYPSCKVVTSELKANIPARICFSLPNASNSRTIISQAGAEKLKGKGDGLFCSGKSADIIRFQCPIVTKEETRNLLKYMEENL
ncbi:MAG: DNA translocase FtsK [Clostridia bacterium]|nr:DNA translocase FtsK [Clostridia bacterium]